MKEVICTCCPQGCHLQVDEANDYKVTGNGCPNGIAYGKEELTHPTRIITSTKRFFPVKRVPKYINADGVSRKSCDRIRYMPDYATVFHSRHDKWNFTGYLVIFFHTLTLLNVVKKVPQGELLPIDSIK